jgi:hypothetical protein
MKVPIKFDELRFEPGQYADGPGRVTFSLRGIDLFEIPIMAQANESFRLKIQGDIHIVVEPA